MKAVVYQEPCKVTVEDPPTPMHKLDKRVDGYTKIHIKPGMAA